MPETKYLSPRPFSKLLTGISEELVRQLVNQGIIPVLWSGTRARIPVEAGLVAIEQYTKQTTPKAAQPYQLHQSLEYDELDRKLMRKKKATK